MTLKDVIVGYLISLGAALIVFLLLIGLALWLQEPGEPLAWHGTGVVV